jgi:hypothetical protein
MKKGIKECREIEKDKDEKRIKVKSGSREKCKRKRS